MIRAVVLGNVPERVLRNGRSCRGCFVSFSSDSLSAAAAPAFCLFVCRVVFVFVFVLRQCFFSYGNGRRCEEATQKRIENAARPKRVHEKKRVPAAGAGPPGPPAAAAAGRDEIGGEWLRLDARPQTQAEAAGLRKQFSPGGGGVGGGARRGGSNVGKGFNGEQLPWLYLFWFWRTTRISSSSDDCCFCLEGMPGRRG